MKILVSAADVSSDMHLAEVIRQFQKQPLSEKQVSFMGLCGESSKQQGAHPWMEARQFMVGGGPFEILSRLPLRRQWERKVEDWLNDHHNELSCALLVDNGEINLRLAQLLHFFKVPVFYYIPPKVWAFRPGRIEVIAQHVTKVLTIFPFEKEIYDDWGIPCTFVGNPLLDEIPETPSLDLFFQKYPKIKQASQKNLCVSAFLGSRYTEIKNHAPVMVKILVRFHELFQQHLGDDSGLLWVLPVPQNMDMNFVREELQKALKSQGENLTVKMDQIFLIQENSREALAASRCALVKSGTSTLEAALIGVPQVVYYQMGWVARFLYKTIVRYQGHVALANLILAKDDAAVVPEYILDQVCESAIAQDLWELFQEGPQREKQKLALHSLRSCLRNSSGASPSECVARELVGD